MNAAATRPSATPKGWIATLFGTRASSFASRSRHHDLLHEPVAIAAVAELLAFEMTEERARAATSGFEMGEYEPSSRRN